MEQHKRIMWSHMDFKDYQRTWNCSRNRERADLKKEIEIARIGSKQAEDILAVTDLARKEAEDQLTSHQKAHELAIAQFEEQLKTDQAQRDEAR